MQLTILSDKLPDLSTKQFIHEFRVVHALETRSMAQSLGIITRYVQGLILRSAGQKELENQPLLDPNEPIQSFAQLSWPALEVMQGALGTQSYKDSAGKHIFAQVREIFLTIRLEDEVPHADRDSGVRLVSVLRPSDALQQHFRCAWDNHATFCRKICSRYQRNQIITLDQARINKIFTGTQFPAHTVTQGGGYEEFLFNSNDDAKVFLEQHGRELKHSYSQFVNKSSYCLGFDVIVQYDDSDRGYQQVVTGQIVATLLRAKLFFGL